MDQFLYDVGIYADAFGVQPTTVVQKAKAGGGSTWASWVSGQSSPTLNTADRVRRYMSANPPPAKEVSAA